jgi:hypothetical protein
VLPIELRQIGTGCRDVADALTGYEAQLAQLKPAFAQAVAMLADARERLAAARAIDATATATLRHLLESGRTAPTMSLIDDELAVARADDAVIGWRSAVARLEPRTFALLDEFAAARDSCAAAIAGAGLTAPGRPPAGSATIVIDLGTGAVTTTGISGLDWIRAPHAQRPPPGTGSGTITVG